MATMNTSDARRLLGLPAGGRVSQKQLQQAYQGALKTWTTALSSAVSGADRQRARDVLGLLPAARAELVPRKGQGKTAQAAANRQAPQKRTGTNPVHAKKLQRACRDFAASVDNISSFFAVPKPVVIIVIALSTFIFMQSCTHHIAKTLSKPREARTAVREGTR